MRFEFLLREMLFQRRFVFILILLLSTAAAFAMMPAVGEKAPGFALQDQNGNARHLLEYRGKVVVMEFYPADFTPGCTIEAHVSSKAYPDYVKAGVILLGISVQDSKSHQAFCEKEGIPYPLLADTEKTVVKQYDVLNEKGYANRVTFILDTQGRIAYVDSDVKSHLQTCAPDWLAWIHTHSAELHK